MPEWPDKWDTEPFRVVLREWQPTARLPQEVFDAVYRWIDSRQDDPWDAETLPEEGTFPDIYTVRARLHDLHRQPIMHEGYQVVCFYEIHDIEHKLVCLYFDVLT